MSNNFKTNRNQDAAPIIRGFLYQVYQTIYLWLKLKDDEVLELEKGEDIDIVTTDTDSRDLLQVKDLEQKITLRTASVTECIFNYYSHRNNNPSVKIKFCFLTTATPTKERNVQFPDGSSGIEIWQKIVAKELKSEDSKKAIKIIKDILISTSSKQQKQNQSKIQQLEWQKWINYLKDVNFSDLEEFISNFSFIPSQLPIEGLKNEVGFELIRQKKATHQDVESTINALLAYVFHKLIEKGTKTLTSENINSCLQSNSVESLKETIKKVENLLEFYEFRKKEYPNQESIITYKKNVREEYKNWNMPQEVVGWEHVSTKQFNPTEIHLFKEKSHYEERLNATSSEVVSYEDLGRQTTNPLWVFIGETGLGKTTFLKYLNFKFAHTDDNQISIYVPLRKISTNNNLKQLLTNELNINGYPIKEEQLYELLKNYPFVLLLDAYDEVNNDLIKSLDSEVIDFTKKCNVILTTRPNRIPHFPKSTLFEIQHLEHDTIKAIIVDYIGEASYYDCIGQVEQHGLIKETTNILLLLLIISVYQKYHRIPRSHSELVETIVNDVFEWVEAKNTENNSWFTREIVEDFLEHLAYKIYDNDARTQLTPTETKDIVREYLTQKSDLREIPKNETIEDFKQKIAALGLVIFPKDGETYFWHRLFLNYFATTIMAKKIVNEDISSKEISVEYKWRVPLSDCSAYLPSKKQQEFLNTIKSNLWLLSENLSNLGNPSPLLLKETVKRLHKCCNSGILELRSYGIYYLIKLNEKHHTYTKNVIWNLFQDSFCLEVRKGAFLEIAKEKSAESKKVVFENANWDETSEYNYIFSTYREAMKALSYYDEEGYWKMYEVAIQRKSSISLTFTDIFSELITFEKLPETLIQRIFDNFLEDIEDEGDYRDNFVSLLKKVRRNEWLPTLVASLSKPNIKHSSFRLKELLKEYDTKECLCLLWEKYGHKDTPVELKRSVSSVLTEYKGDVPLEYYLTIIKSTDNDCKTYGITGLGRFEYNKIKHVLIELLNDEEHLIHHKTLEISFENGFIVDLVNEGFITQDYLNKCSKRIDIFLEAITKYGLYKHIDFALEILKESATEKSLILYVKALVFDNQVERAFQNFKWNYYDEDELKYTHNTDSSTHNRRFQRNIFEFINIFPPSFALQILRDLNDKLEEVNCNRCINTFSYKINSLCRNSPSFEFVPFLKELIIDRLEKNNFLEMDNSNILEQYIIALSYLMQNNDESWLVEVCTKYKNIPSESLVRLLAQLSQIAYLETTLKLAKQIGHRYRSFELVLHYCYKICDTYYRKNGILKQVTEAEFFEST